MRASRIGLVALLALAGCKRDGSNVAENPDCTEDLTVLAIDAGVVPGGTTDASVGVVASDGGEGGGGGKTGVVYAPCNGVDTTGDDDNADFGNDASTGFVVCPSYTCVCDDTTTQTGSASDPATGACDAESQVCGIICTSHGGWM